MDKSRMECPICGENGLCVGLSSADFEVDKCLNKYCKYRREY